MRLSSNGRMLASQASGAGSNPASRILLLITLCYAISHPFPAVLGEHGVIVNVSVEPINDTQLLIQLNPFIGISTQQSLINAWTVAQRLANKHTGFKVMFENISREIDGPSGGAQFALLFYAALTNMTLRNDFIMTGTIDKYGRIGPVGGLYYKVCASPFHYFLFPRSTGFLDKVLSVRAAHACNKTLIVVNNITDAIDFVFNNTIHNYTLFSPTNTNISVDKRAPYHPPHCPALARHILAKEQQLLTMPTLPRFQPVIQAIKQRLQHTKKLLDKGFCYTAANNAFLDTISLQLLNLNNSLNLNDLRARAQHINITFQNVSINENNADWIAAAEARLGWAQEKLADVEQQRDQGVVAKHVYTAEAWRDSALHMYSIGKSIRGRPITTQIIKKRIEDVKKRLEKGVSEDALFYLHAAQRLEDEHRYLGALFSYDYALAFSTTCNHSIDEHDFQTLKTEWAQIYGAQAYYLYLRGEDEEACKILTLSKLIDESFTFNNSYSPDLTTLSVLLLPIFFVIGFATGFVATHLAQ